MDYLELAVSVRQEAVEVAADLLRWHVPSGISIEPVTHSLDEDGGVAIDAVAPARLRAWLPVCDESLPIVRALRRELRMLGSLAGPLRTRTVRDSAWADAWKRYFRVLRIGKSLVIRPSWRNHRARRGDIVIELDPGMAFGTGQHPTTRMCLEELERRVEPGANVLDVGCGSGILSVAAALLSGRVDALDIDPASVQATIENAKRNRVQRAVRVREGSLGEAWPFRVRQRGRYDIVVANLSSRLVRELARPLVKALRPEGVLLASGLIAAQESVCREALLAAGAGSIERRASRGWRLLIASRT